MKYRVTLELFLDAADKSEAEEVGSGAVEHLLDTFNDNETIQPIYRINVQQVKERKHK